MNERTGTFATRRGAQSDCKIFKLINYKGNKRYKFAVKYFIVVILITYAMNNIGPEVVPCGNQSQL